MCGWSRSEDDVYIVCKHINASWMGVAPKRRCNMDELQQQVDILEGRIMQLEKSVAIDRFSAEKERTRRWNQDEKTKANRLTVHVKHGEDGVMLLAEHISDPVKFSRLVKKNVISKIVHVKSPNRGKWAVNPAAADREGFLLIEVSV